MNAHATSTPEGDKSELLAIRTLLGDHASKVSITANKSMLGHTLGAAGAIEAIVTIQTIRTVRPADDQPRELDDQAGDLDSHRRCARAQDVASRCRTRSGSAARTRRCCSAVEDAWLDRPM